MMGPNFKSMKSYLKLFPLFVLILNYQFLFSQNIPVLKIAELQKRIPANSDTTYIINFFASWCAPCMKELPDFESFSQKYKSTNTKVILVSLDFKKDYQKTLPEVINKLNIKSEMLFLDEPNPDYWINKIDSNWTGEIPATLFVNKKNNYEKLFAQPFTEAELENICNKINQGYK